MSSAGRIRVLSMATARLWLGLILILMLRTATAQGVNFTLDFEAGDLRGWRASGTAFSSQPTLDDNPTARDRGMPSRHQGRYWIGTFENYQGRPGQDPGDVQGDRPQGKLVSATFISPGGTLSFLIGGGKQFETRVELWLDVPIEGSVRVCTRTGSDSETMGRQECDLNEFLGQPMYMAIVDDSSGPWGHINVDDFRFSALVEVPQLRNRELDQAHGMIREAGLAIGPTNYMNVGDRPNVVVRQTPPGGQLVERGTSVTLYVSRRPPEPPVVKIVPELIGDQFALAQRKIRFAGLNQREVTRESSDRPAGTVIDQAPVSGTEVLPDTPVDLAISTGVPPTVEVPGVIGGRLRLAQQEILAAGLRVGAVSEEDSEQPAGTVVDQAPLRGTEVPAETSVDLVISTGVAPTAEVPDVIGDRLGVAEQEIRGARLRVGVVTEEENEQPTGTVIDQAPFGGMEVRSDTPVDLVVSIGVASTVEVPSVIGNRLRRAEQEILDAGLRVGGVTEEDSDRPAGTVIQQSPQAGRQVARGSNIAVWVARSPEPVIVPDVIGMSLAAAGSKLQSSRLRKGRVSHEVSSRTPNQVISQRPTAGKRVPPGTSVALVLASWVVWGGAALLVGLTVAVSAFRFWPSGPHSLPGVTTKVHQDAGSIVELTHDGGPVKSDTHAQFVKDAGQQTADIETNAIKSEQRNNDDD